MTSKLKNIRSNYKKAVDLKKRRGCGGVVVTFYDICSDIWSCSLATTGTLGRLESSIIQDNTEQLDVYIQNTPGTPPPQEDDEEEVLDVVSRRRDDRKQRLSKYLKEERNKRMQLSIANEELN